LSYYAGVYNVKDIYETFLRFDDKPMILNIDTVSRSILRYCYEGHFAIASGEKNNYEKIYYKENVPYFDVTDTTYWIVDKSLYKTSDQEGEISTGDMPFNEAETETMTSFVNEEDRKVFKSITIKGKVDVANYQQIFTSFIHPLVNNNVDIEIKITGRSNTSHPITEASDQYRITKESANQLGLEFDLEE